MAHQLIRQCKIWWVRYENGTPCSICTNDFRVLQTLALDYSANGALKLADTVGLAPTIFRVRADCVSITLSVN